MRKVIKRPDGTEEVVEGTAEEIAEYERAIKEGGKPQSSKKKPVLRGAEVDGKPLTDEETQMIRLHRLGLLPKERVVVEKEPAWVPYVQPYWLTGPTPTVTDRTCKYCGALDCNQLHIVCRDSVTLSDSTLPSEQVTGRISFSLSDAAASALETFHKLNQGWTPTIKIPS